MKQQNETQSIPTGAEVRIQIIRLEELTGKSLTNDYYAKKLNRSQGAISQALSDYPNTETLRGRISRHNNWLERKHKERKQLKIAS